MKSYVETWITSTVLYLMKIVYVVFFCNEVSKEKAVIVDSIAIKYEEFYIHNKFLNFHILHYM